MPDIKLDAVVEAALAASGDRRDEILDEAFANRPELREQAEAMIRDLENSPPSTEAVTQIPNKEGTEPATITLGHAVAEKQGDSIGPYKLREPLGEGGMGSVYLAEQEKPVRRRVALKVIKPGLDTAEVIARFEAERQALALMDHLNIARVLDAGTTISGRPYFVMELVQGAPITKYCDRKKLSIRERIELFVPVCNAIQHAHQKGIIHRDLKPSNILVTLKDDEPVAKVIDFGIAKATTQRLTERTIYTQHGQIVGTPQYMSPEQAGMAGLDVDTRSDVYSLGAILYELLAGVPPFDGKRLSSVGIVAMLEIIGEEDPPTPSRRVTDLGERLSDVAQRRSAEQDKLPAHLSGELDWIVMKALDKDRTRRYESANMLGADLQRYLNNEPVEACPPSATYRLKKYIRRNRGPLTAAAAIAALLLVGTIVSTWQAVRATNARSALAVEQEKTLAQKRRADQRRQDAETAKVRAQELEGVANQRWQEAEDAKKLVEQRGGELKIALQQAQDAAEREKAASDELQRRLRMADAMRLAMQSQQIRDRYPQRALLLAAEAANMNRRSNQAIMPSVHQALREAMGNIGGEPIGGHLNMISMVEHIRDGKMLLTGDSTKAQVFKFANAGTSSNASPLQLHAAIGRAPLAFDPSTNRLATSGQGRNMHVYDLNANDLNKPAKVLSRPGSTHGQLFISPGGRWLVNHTTQVDVWDMNADTGDIEPRTFVVPQGSRSYLNHVAISPDDRWLLSSGYSRGAALSNLLQENGATDSIQLPIKRMRQHEFSPDGRWLITQGNLPGDVHLWDLRAENILASQFTFDNAQDVATSKGNIVRRSGTQITGYAFSLNSQFVATASNGTVQIWNIAQSPVSAASIGLPRKAFNPSVAFTADSKRIVAGSRQLLALYDVASGEQIKPLLDAPLSSGTVTYSSSDRLALGPAGRWLLAEWTDQLHLWDLNDDNPERSMRTLISGEGYSGVEFSDSGDTLIATLNDGTVRVWNLQHANPKQSEIACRGHDSLVGHVAVIGDGRWLVTAAGDATPRLWELPESVATNRSRPRQADQQVEVGRTSRSVLGVQEIGVRPDGKWILVGYENVFVADPMREGFIESKFRNPASNTVHAISADGRWLATNSYQNRRMVNLWDLTDPDRFVTSDGGIFRRAFDQLINASSDAEPHVQIDPGAQTVFNSTLSGRGNWLVIPYRDGTNPKRAQLWKLASGESDPSKVDLGEIDDDDTAVFSDDGKWLLVVHNNPQQLPALWNLVVDPPQAVNLELGDANPSDGQSAGRTATGGFSDVMVAFGGSGKWMALKGQGFDSPLYLWDLQSAQPHIARYALSIDSAYSNAQFAISPDGRFFACESRDAIAVWDLSREGFEDGKPMLLRGHENYVQRVAFSADGRWLFSADSDHVRMWDMSSHDPQSTVLTLATVDRPIRNLISAPDGSWLCGLGSDGKAHFWQISAESMVDDAYHIAGRELSNEEIERYRLDAPDIQRGRWLRQAADFESQLQREPDNVDLIKERAVRLAFGGEYIQAADEMLRAAELENFADHWTLFRTLPLLAMADRKDRYRELSAQMLQEFGNEREQLEILERVAKGAMFWRNAEHDWKPYTQLADTALQQATEQEHWVLRYTYAAKALAHYRTGDFDRAIEWAEKALGERLTNDTVNLIYPLYVPAFAVRAMALAQLGRVKEAKTSLAEAKREHAKGSTPLDGRFSGWHDWMISEILFDEAEAVIAANADKAMQVAGE